MRYAIDHQLAPRCERLAEPSGRISTLGSCTAVRVAAAWRLSP